MTQCWLGQLEHGKQRPEHRGSYPPPLARPWMERWERWRDDQLITLVHLFNQRFKHSMAAI